MVASSSQTLRQWLSKEPFSCTLSSGFFSFFAHLGFLSALEQQRLRPQRLSGSSAGALVGGFYAAGLDCEAIRRQLFALTRQDFWDPSPGLGLLRGRRFRQLLDQLLPVRTFGRCRLPLAVSAFDIFSGRTRVLSQGLLAPAIQASCTVPGLFAPVWIDYRPYWDGGIADRPGLAGMPVGERLLFHNITARSPWRRKDSPALAPPRRPLTVTVGIAGLPRLNPFALERGHQAYWQAQQATLQALEQPLRSPVIEVSV